ncbi:MAG: SagB/ThcOx family dehydrogenase [Acidobacteriota bacterium]
MEQPDLGEEEVAGRRVHWREYHEATKHTVERLAGERRQLDWANMPAPFRHYEGAPLIDLPADIPEPSPNGATSAAQFLSQLLFYSASISATKIAPSGMRYALRVNPSSGNLHPTEFHFATRGLGEWPDGLFHYRASSHEAEQRATGDWVTPILASTLAPWSRNARLLFVLTSIFWREAWKYRGRAYRYCCHDMGHAWESLAQAARALGCETHTYGHFLDDKLRRALNAADDEQPMLLIAVMGGPGADDPPKPAEPQWFGGEPNALSIETTGYPLIDAVHRATLLTESLAPIRQPAPAVDGQGVNRLPKPAISNERFATITRRRRSALDFQPHAPAMPLQQLAAILHSATQPHVCDFEADLTGMPASRFVSLFLYVHNVADLDRGVYRYWPGTHTLETILPGDHRVAAAGLSLGQDLAGNCTVAFSMIADLERATDSHGDRGYRYVHFEAGAIGQRLYLGAESFGWQATGIGAFYDDAVHQYLRLSPEQGQVIYHFAIGRAVHDPRLSESAT